MNEAKAERTRNERNDDAAYEAARAIGMLRTYDEVHATLEMQMAPADEGGMPADPAGRLVADVAGGLVVGRPTPAILRAVAAGVVIRMRDGGWSLSARAEDAGYAIHEDPETADDHRRAYAREDADRAARAALLRSAGVAV